MLSMIVAASLNNVIGRNNVMPWHLSEDLKHFKTLTTGHDIVMGRKTFESLGKPLPNRRNIVLTRDAQFRRDGVDVIHSPEEILQLQKNDSNKIIFIIGGSEIYKLFLPHVQKIHLTRILQNFEGDAFLPEIPWNQFRQTEDSGKLKSEKNNLEYQFLTFERHGS